jgi:hypothetical protein
LKHHDILIFPGLKHAARGENMQANTEQAQGAPSMDTFSANLKKTVVRFAGIALALTLLAALWSTALAQLSQRSTAITLLTQAGTDLINPLLTANGSGLGQTLYQQLQAQASAHPHQALQIAFLRISIPGAAIAGKSFADGSRAIYAQVAAAYYDGGPNAVFVLPPQLQALVGSYTPFVPTAQSIHSPLPSVPIPQLPAFASNLWSAIGFTPTTLTAAGHSAAEDRLPWLWGISAALALLIVLLSTGWDRLWHVAWPLFHSSWHIALLGIIGAILVHRNIANAGTYQPVMDLIGGTFMPIFYVAAATGIAAIAICLVGRRFTAQKPSQAAPAAVAPVPLAATRFAAPPQQDAGSPMPPPAPMPGLATPEAPLAGDSANLPEQP